LTEVFTKNKIQLILMVS